jgi:uncharacterized protein YggE
MLPLLLLVTLTSTAPVPGPRHIVVVGTARVVSKPNQAVLRGAFQASGRDQAAAKKAADERVRKMLAALLAAGVERDQVSVDQSAPMPDQRGVEIIAWQQNLSLSVSLKDLSKLDDAATALVKSGVSLTGPVMLENTEHEQAESKARISAAVNARERAKGMVEALGAKLGLLVSVSDSTPAVATTAVNALQATADGPVTTGWASRELVTNSQVTVQFDIDAP